ncbi:unnamed protein product, partial [Rotaria sp. Silwood2]
MENHYLESSCRSTSPLQVIQSARNEKVKLFSNFSDAENCLNWLKNLQQIGKSLKLNEQQIYELATIKLSGPAQEWFYHQDEIDNWSSFKEAFLYAFPPPIQPTNIDYLAQLLAHKQGETEPVGKFVQDINRLCLKLDNKISEEDKLQYLRRGLRPQFQHYALSISSSQDFLTIISSSNAPYNYRGVVTSSSSRTSGFGQQQQQLLNRPDRNYYNHQQNNHSTYYESPDYYNKNLHAQTSAQQQANNYLICYQCEDWIRHYQVTINGFTNKIEILGNKASVPLRTSATSKVLFSQEIIQIQDYCTNLIIININDYPLYLTSDTILGFISFPTRDDQIVNKNDIELKNNNDIKFANQAFPIILTDESCDDNRSYQHYENYNSKAIQHAHMIPPYVNTIKNSTQVTSSIANDIKITLDQVVEHIVNLQEKTETRNIIGKYKKIFDTSSPTIALTPIHHTTPTGDHPPINSVPYRRSLQQQQALKKIIDPLEKSNQIRLSSSPWSSPVLLIKKKDDDYRFVVDYRKLNGITTKDSYPIPTIESTLQQLAGNCCFSKLDLRSGYFQVPISEIDKPKTAFITTTGLWEFNVLPMGLTNAPPSFQRIMYNLVVNGREHCCLVYLDDIIIFSKTFKDHMKHLDEILSILDKHRFQLNPSKCSIMRTKIDYLGHSINEYGIAPLYDNIKAIRELPIPDHPTLKQANEFIGGLGFYRKFIKSFSKIAAPIHRVTNLTKDNTHKFKWGEEQRQAVQQLKQIITGPDLVLEFPDPKLSYVLSTDASRVGLGAVLKQIAGDGRIKIIYYLSRVLTNTELRYSTTELEALAIVWAITKLRPYLLGKDFRIETDHCPLCQFHKKRSRNGRLDRWAIEILFEYN